MNYKANLSASKSQKKYMEKYRAKNAAVINSYLKKYRKENAECLAQKKKEYCLQFPERIMLARAKKRAKYFHLPFNLEIENICIPEYCPVLGIKLVIGTTGDRDNSPSLDKVIPELGYIKGNVRVISWRANRLKSDATADELDKLSIYVRSECQK